MISFLISNYLLLSHIILTILLTFNISSINSDNTYLENIKLKGVALGEVFGNPIKPTEYIYVVGLALVYKNENLGVCTGSLISNKIVLTSAHCYDETIDHIKVYKSVCPLYGFDNNITDYRDVAEYKSHENKDEHDIMVLFLSRPFSEIKKFSKLYGCNEIFRNSEASIPHSLETFSIGCGDTEKKIKCMKPQENAAKTHYVISRRIIPIVTSYIPNYCTSGNKITRKDGICSNNMFHVRKLCTGDIGGPLLYIDSMEIKQIGIIIDDCDDNFQKTCGCKNVLSAQTNIYFYKDWIYEKTNIKIEECPEIKLKLPPINIFMIKSSQAKQSNVNFTIQLLVIVIILINFVCL